MREEGRIGEAAILGIGTAVPPYRIEQSEASARLARALGEDKDVARWAKRIFHQCGVETRYTCEPELLEEAENCRYVPGTPPERVPATDERMAVYRRESAVLGKTAALRALLESGTAADDITHLLTVTCTGLYLPGLDAALVRELGLRRETERQPLQFLGCAAGLRAVCVARTIADREPSAKILVVCVELCTLHIQPSGSREDLYAAAFFGDGASACVIGRPDTCTAGPYFKLGAHRTVLLPESTEEMVWNIGNQGFSLYLSSRIPELLRQFIPGEIYALLQDDELPPLWAIHPGGKGIVDAVEARMELTPEQTAASRSVLRRYGNLSSATILFVLQEMRERLRLAGSKNSEGIALAFGPGLTAELLRFEYCAAVPVPAGLADAGGQSHV
ncbi:type III polyketide synthase [Paenibacillus gansuensis]|uniref:Type III polyketide synthase n=1 Tax=Paenibacillus gansuensis TaxID=306542 RepID=A0ABW5PEJ0_9BACL